MDDPPPHTDDAGTPRWVKAFGAVGVAVVLAIVAILLAGGAGDHGPGRHLDRDGHTGPPPGIEHDSRQP